MLTSYLIAIGISFGLSAIIAFFWVRGIDYMKKNHPDYTGEEFLNWDGKNPWNPNQKEEKKEK